MTHTADDLAPSARDRVLAALDELMWRFQAALQKLCPHDDPAGLAEVPIIGMALGTLQVPLAWEHRADILEDLLRLRPFHTAAQIDGPQRPH